MRSKNLIGALGGGIALLGFFLPYTEEVTFFQSLDGPDHGFFAPALVLLTALTAILYALGFKIVPASLGITLLVMCLAFPGGAVFQYGFFPVIRQLRIGAWTLFAGQLLMVIHPLLYRSAPSRP